MNGTSGQMPDGSWQPIVPLGWQPGIDWEVYKPGKDRTCWEAIAYDEDVTVAVVRSRWKPLLRIRMALAHRRLTR